jgi:hypothetical protein
MLENQARIMWLTVATWHFVGLGVWDGRMLKSFAEGINIIKGSDFIIFIKADQKVTNTFLVL